MEGTEGAVLSGAGHLLSFTGTDTVPAIDFLEQYYGADSDKELIGGSVPATEHSVMCMGTQESELETYRRLITEVYPAGIVSIVSDTWDYWKVWTEIIPALKEDILNREGTLTIRPDSGDPVKIICGDPLAPVGSPEHKGSFELAWEIFGGTVTEQGYKQLDSHINLIYGDSITYERCKAIVEALMNKGFVPSMIFGIGSFTYQYNTRDTFGFAMKATYGEVNGEPREIFKDPKTDSGTKKSAKGLLAVFVENGEFVLKQQATWTDVKGCAFKRVFSNGKILNEPTLSEIRGRLEDARKKS
jgi:nicotinamide phosphoribosyltransferase